MHAVASLVAFAMWTLLLVAGVFAYRGLRVLGGTAINAWPRGNKPADDAPLVKRLEDAHANALENLPIFAVVVLAAAALGKLALLDHVAVYALYARISQTLAHLSGTGKPQVLARATFWAAQLGLFFYMGYLVLHG